MNKDIEKIIKKNKHRSTFYKEHKENGLTIKTCPVGHQKNGHDKLKKFLYATKNRILISLAILLLLLISKKNYKYEVLYVETFKHLNFAQIDHFITKYIGTIFPKFKDGNLAVNNSYISLDNSSEYENGLIITTSPFETIQSHTNGVVIKKYYDDVYGDTIVVQDEFGREFYYGYLEDIKVNLYSRISYGEDLGIARISENMVDGSYYLSIKDGDAYLSVIDVVNDES
ncbi:MAG: peptidase family protein [Haloplasmataceae bacterium]|jgi:hypothetical protein|nr:peptidase family protein [Haloplasmataceae bacterium]